MAEDEDVVMAALDEAQAMAWVGNRAATLALFMVREPEFRDYPTDRLARLATRLALATYQAVQQEAT